MLDKKQNQSGNSNSLSHGDSSGGSGRSNSTFQKRSSNNRRVTTTGSVPTPGHKK